MNLYWYNNLVFYSTMQYQNIKNLLGETTKKLNYITKTV